MIQLHDLYFQPYLSHTIILKRVQELGKKIQADYEGKRPLFLGVLNGAFIFAADLLRACESDCEISFIKLSSYNGLKSIGSVQTLIGLDMSVENRPIILVEDIVDSGQTLHDFIPELEKMNPASIALAALLVKPTALKFPIKIDYLGFEIPDKFVIGYGLDYNGLGRNLRDIYQMVEE